MTPTQLATVTAHLRAGDDQQALHALTDGGMLTREALAFMRGWRWELGIRKEAAPCIGR